jgi:hypothetical protein
LVVGSKWRRTLSLAATQPLPPATQQRVASRLIIASHGGQPAESFSSFTN